MSFATIMPVVQLKMFTSDFQYYKEMFYVFIFTLWLWWIWSRRHFYRFAWTLPGPYGLPVFGTIFNMKGFRDAIPHITSLFENYKRHTLHSWVGVRPVLLTSDPIFLEKVLTSSELLNRAQIYKLLENVCGKGLLSLSMPEWQIHRKKISPAFNHKILLSFLPIFHRARNNVLKKFESMADDNKFHDITKLLFETSMEISLETIMGRSPAENNIVNKSFPEEFEFILRQTMLKGLLTYLNLSKLYILDIKYVLVLKRFRESMTKLFNEKLRTLNLIRENSLQNDSDQEFNIKKKPHIFVDQILQIHNSNGFTLEEVKSEVKNMLSASFETTALSLLSVLTLIAIHSDVQQRLYEELVNVFPDENFRMEYEHMEQLPYLEMVIKESLRIFPPVGFIGRRVVKNTKIADDFILPKGLEIIICIYHLHRRADIWGPNAHKFDPDHFLHDNERKIHKYAYIPFSAGVRNCIGWRYALFLMRNIIAGIVRKYTLECNMNYEEIEFDLNMSLKFKKEPLLKFYKR